MKLNKQTYVYQEEHIPQPRLHLNTALELQTS